jgi:Flp pilus assembly protein TadG
VSARRREDEGQAAVELALVLPLVVALLLVILQVGLIVRDQVLVVHAAREAARAAAVEPDPVGAATRAAAEAAGLRSSRLRVTVSGGHAPGSHVRVEVRYRAPTDVPLVGGALRDVTLVGRATMRVEQ